MVNDGNQFKKLLAVLFVHALPLPVPNSQDVQPALAVEGYFGRNLVLDRVLVVGEGKLDAWLEYQRDGEILPRTGHLASYWPGLC